jgi:hypothetical protein
MKNDILLEGELRIFFEIRIICTIGSCPSLKHEEWLFAMKNDILLEGELHIFFKI